MNNVQSLIWIDVYQYDGLVKSQAQESKQATPSTGQGQDCEPP